ncbi:hypothetical protein BAY61_21590 [Prauserella marina]|uniref:Uncharacterized protein n=2 Tax=Prauserella marina TaxID=530584 RepID=A0A222VT90_9PSEU|nr:hypothetical protein BAY61_21590 [Prauserella marina]PWV72463.1 hypothetical protein DES30_11061 [Prauserella marina]SDD79480.1 hypothetical protein SAMN05421630_112177 [Prauserella marina]
MGSRMAEPGETVMVVRMRRGTVGETRRVCHVVPVPGSGPIPETLTAYCGERIPQGKAELLRTLCGMPCDACLAVSAARSGALGMLPASP